METASSVGMNAPVDMNYPNVLSEWQTLNQALEGRSLSRFGDGELRLALGGSAVSQPPNRQLEIELKTLLVGPTYSLVCLPRYGFGPRKENWDKYVIPKWRKWMRQEVYGSAFISRPDSAPEINTPEYWQTVRKLWTNRDVVLLVGTDYGSLNEHMLRDARDLRMVYGMPKNAYVEIDRLEQEIGVPKEGTVVLLCLGATATVLAERLARKGVWAVDLGHLGKFMPKEFR